LLNSLFGQLVGVCCDSSTSEVCGEVGESDHMAGVSCCRCAGGGGFFPAGGL
jgi:hypothetical protein